MYAFSVTSVPLCRSHTEMYLNCLHSQYAIVNHISDIDTANMTLGKRGKTIVHRFYYKHDQLAERAALQPHFDHTASRSRTDTGFVGEQSSFDTVHNAGSGKPSEDGLYVKCIIENACEHYRNKPIMFQDDE